jgi:hypothetical protein
MAAATQGPLADVSVGISQYDPGMADSSQVTPDEWWMDRREVTALARALVEVDQLGDPVRAGDTAIAVYRTAGRR